MSRKRLRRGERRQLADLRMAERHFSRLGTLIAFGTTGDVVKTLSRRHMIRRIDSGWRPTASGGQVLTETYALTDRGRVAADQVIYNERVRVLGRSTPGAVASPDLMPYLSYGRVWNFNAQVGLRRWPNPERDESERYERETRDLNMAPPRPSWSESDRLGYDAIRRTRLEAVSRARVMNDLFQASYPVIGDYQRFLGRLIRIPAGEPLDRAIDSLDSGYAFVEDAHRRLRQLEDARRVHDAGDEDDGAIERGLEECRRIISRQIAGDQTHLVEAVCYSMPRTVSAHALEAARANPPRLYERMCQLHDEAEERASATGHGLFFVDSPADKSEGEST